MLVGDDNKPFHDINGNPIIIDLALMQDMYNNQKVYGVVDFFVDPGSSSKMQRKTEQKTRSQGTSKISPKGSGKK